jgi:hypothetical protein
LSRVAANAKSPTNESDLCFTIAVDAPSIARPDGYRLSVREHQITLVGATSAACFHGLQTLFQLDCHHHDVIPCCEIVDWPDFRSRGLLHDVTRGKSPTLATLKSLADRLASLKINQFQLYIEHAFTFGFDSDIAGPNDALTPDEIRELDAYCRERFIDLVPAVATLGHMGRILSMPRYRHLAEIEPGCEWAGLGWLERARGFTLDVTNPESHRLVERIWSEMLDAFPSPIVNVCGDEPWDLGKGKNRERFSAHGVGEAYIDHILRTHAICARRGRRTQVWSDVVRNHPDLFHLLPPDLTVLHWGYDDRADYEGTRGFVEAGLDTIVCPGTSGWKRIINAMGLAERNIADFAAAGKRHGATGLLNTDWGDHGHFNLLACSWHGIALGAALAWRADHTIGDDFDERFARTFVGWASPADQNRDHVGCVPDAPFSLIRILRDASCISNRCETWRLLWQPIARIKADSTLPSIDDADRSAESARRAIEILKRIEPTDVADDRDRDELIVACRFTELFAGKIRLLRAASGMQSRSAGSSRDSSGFDPAAWEERLSFAAQEFADCWCARNKPSGLRDILDALDTLRSDIASYHAES